MRHDSFNSTTSSRSSQQTTTTRGLETETMHRTSRPSKLINTPPNVPPSDEELEASIDKACHSTLITSKPGLAVMISV